MTPLLDLPLPLRAIPHARYSGVMIYERHGIPRADLDALVEQGWLRLSLGFWIGDYELENAELNDDGSVTDLDTGDLYPKKSVLVTYTWLTTDKVLETREHNYDLIRHAFSMILDQVESARKGATALGDAETLRALGAISTLASVVNRRCELVQVQGDPGPAPEDPEGPLAPFEDKARWALDAIAQNPDGHHWTYIACVIKEVADSVADETASRVGLALGGLMEDSPPFVCDRVHAEVLDYTPGACPMEDFALAGVLPMRVEDDDGELTEVTICSSIAGGAREVDGMPKDLTLVRRAGDGGEITQRYVQASAVEEALEEERFMSEAMTSEAVDEDRLLRGASCGLDDACSLGSDCPCYQDGFRNGSE